MHAPIRTPFHVLARIAAVLALAAPLAQAAVVADPEPPAQSTSAHGAVKSHFSAGELDRLLAPVALYPDTVLTHVLAAATYPLEVVEAARWSREHPDLRGEDAVDAVERMDWDPSVKALVAFPDLLARMDSDLHWTQDLGDAFLSDEGGVMDRVQVLRDHADEAGHLNSVEHVRVVREREYIYLEPDVAEVVYVPYYDPLVVYGAWWWPAYPPYRWTWWAGHPAAYYSSYGGFWWGIGFRVAPSFYYCDFDWPRRRVVVVNHYDTTYRYSRAPERYEGASRWHHAPEHRHGVAYRTPAQNEQWHRGYSRPERDERNERTGPRDRDDVRERNDTRERNDERGRPEARREARPQWDSRERSSVQRTAPAAERDPRTERRQAQREQPQHEQAQHEPQQEQAESRPQRREAPAHQNEGRQDNDRQNDGRQDDGRQRHGQRRPDRN